MSQISREAAEAIVGRIRRDNGGITEHDRSTWPREAIETISNLRRQLAASTRTLATNLYSSDARFLYELIQNAEDNSYSRANREGSVPLLHFKIHPDRIYIDSNEDGFEEEHVKAICSIGESSKQNVTGYIGEKGIGFKSIFKVAKKVHIQSGPFSFSFTYTQASDEDGLGMVTPYEEPHLELPADVTTRFTITPRNDSSFQQRVQDIKGLPKTFLLFLNKLKTITVTVCPQDAPVETTSYSTSDSGSNLETIVEMTSNPDNVSLTEYKFYVARKLINNLPHDAARPDTNAATVVLAFPVDNNFEPIETHQHTYAYLPLRNLGFKFVIQSDFITQASREDIFDSPWNRALRNGVAETFKDAVLNFCQHPQLQYTWMRYLPEDSIADDFWKGLRQEVHSLLCD